MRKVIEGCKVCGKQMLTDETLLKRTCDACKAKQVRESSRRLAARRKARRHAFKAGMEAHPQGFGSR